MGEPNYQFAATAIGCFVGVLLEKHTREEIKGMLSQDNLDKVIDIVGDSNVSIKTVIHRLSK